MKLADWDKIEFDLRSNGKESNDNHDEDNCDDDGENKKTSKTRKSVSVPSGVKTATKKSTASSLSGSKTFLKTILCSLCLFVYLSNCNYAHSVSVSLSIS